MMAPRQARAAPLSCRACRQKKRRCDRNRPCSNCVQRSEHCEYEVKGHSSETRLGRSRSRDLTSATLGSGRAESSPSARSEQNISSESGEIFNRLRRLEDAVFGAAQTTSFSSDNGKLGAQGKDGTPFWSLTMPNDSETSTDSVTPRIVSQLPPVDQARELFRHFATVFQPHVAILHIPSTQAMMETAYRTLSEGGVPDPTAMLTLFTVFAGSAMSWTTDLLKRLNSTRDNASAAYKTYTRLAMMIVDDSRHNLPPSASALAALITLAQVVLNSDDEFRMKESMLRSRCLMMARGMQLHRLDTAQSREERNAKGYNSVDIEVQRRAWWHLVASDWFGSFSGGPSEGVYTMHPRHMNVQYPSNVDDEMIEPDKMVFPCPRSTPTFMSHFYERLRTANICREIVDAYPPIIEGAVEPPYDVVMAFDKKLQDMRDTLPFFFQLDPLSIEKSREICAQRPYIAWQRLLANFGMYARICRLHRPYHVRGFWRAEYSYSRFTCHQAAQKILELRRSMDEVSVAGSFQPERMWVITQHVFLAALVLATDVSFNPEAPDARLREEKVMLAYRTLERSKKASNHLLGVVQGNMQTLLTTLQGQRPRPFEAKKDATFNITDQLGQTHFRDSGAGECSDAESRDVAMSMEPSMARQTNTDQLWSEFLAAVPDLQNFEWNTLFDNMAFDMH